MKKKLLLLACVTISNTLDGVAKKVNAQYNTFSQYYDSTLLCYDETGLSLIHNGISRHINIYSDHRKIALFKLAKKIYKDNFFDFIYIRYPRSDIFFISFLKTIYRCSTKVVIEIPSYPYDYEKILYNFSKEYVLRFFDRYYRKKLHKYVDRIVTYSNGYDKIWNIPTIVTINGINFASFPIRDYKDHSGIILTMTAYFSSRHGCDRLIKGIGEYYLNGGTTAIELHLVGKDDGVVFEQWKKLVSMYGIEAKVHFDGFCDGTRLDDIFRMTDIAVNSLAIHRSGWKDESSLKAREYVARGIPILSATKMDVLDEKNYEKYVLQVSLSDEAINMNTVIDFIKKLELRNKHQDISKNIRDAAQHICDMNVTLKKIIDYFNEGRLKTNDSSNECNKAICFNSR